MPEADYFISRDHIQRTELCIVPLFCLCGRDISDGLRQAAVVRPVDPFERFPFDRGHGFPGPRPVDDFGFAEAVYRFGQALPDR